MGGIRTGHSLRCGWVGNIIKRGQLFIKFCQGLLQHLAVAWALGGLQLTGQTLAGEDEVFALAISFLVGSGKIRAGGTALVLSVGLLLLDGFTFPPACHYGVTPTANKFVYSKLPNKTLACF